MAQAIKRELEPHEVPYNDKDIKYIDGNPLSELKSDNPETVRSVINPTDKDFTHAWGGVPYTIPAYSVGQFREPLALHLAKHFAQKLYYEPYFSKYLPHETRGGSVDPAEITRVMKLLLDRKEEEMDQVIAEIGDMQKQAASVAEREQFQFIKERQVVHETVKAREEKEAEQLEAAKVARGEVTPAVSVPSAFVPTEKPRAEKPAWKEFVADAMKRGMSMKEASEAYKKL